jgi:hypothetical protein
VLWVDPIAVVRENNRLMSGFEGSLIYYYLNIQLNDTVAAVRWNDNVIKQISQRKDNNSSAKIQDSLSTTH